MSDAITGMRQSRAKSPSLAELRSARVSAVLKGGVEDEGGGTDFVGGLSNSKSISSSTSSIPPFGLHTEERLQRRAMRSGSPIDNDLVQEVITNPAYSKKGNSTGSPQRPSTTAAHISTYGAKRSAHQRQRQAGAGNSGFSADSPYSKFDQASLVNASRRRVPNARLGGESITPSAVAALGSSQQDGCQGDFCEVRLHGSNENGYSSHTQRFSSNGGGDYRKQLLAAGVFEDETTPGFRVESRAKTAISANRDDHAASYRISFRSILAARAELPLVQRQLERHSRGDPAPYCTTDDVASVSNGEGSTTVVLPAHAYRTVNVCNNCFQVYYLIDGARSRALAALEKKKQKKVGGKRSNKNGSRVVSGGSLVSGGDSLEDSLTSSQMVSSQVLPSMSIVTNDEEGDISRSDETEHLKRAFDAISGLTKNDVAELRALPNPPAVVEVVIEAVLTLLTGRPVAFREAQRLLGAGEAFLHALRSLRPADLSPETLTAMQRYVDHPLFSPQIVLPASRCASKFCAWVRGMVHAARHLRGENHPRLEGPLVSNSDENVATSQLSVDTPIHMRKSKMRPSTGATTGNGVRLMRTPDAEVNFVRQSTAAAASTTNILPSPNRQALGSSATTPLSRSMHDLRRPLTVEVNTPSSSGRLSRKLPSRLDPGPSPSSLLDLSFPAGVGGTGTKNINSSPRKKKKKVDGNGREAVAIAAMQRKTTDRLAAQTAMEGSVGVLGRPKLLICSDRVSSIPYLVVGQLTAAAAASSSTEPLSDKTLAENSLLVNDNGAPPVEAVNFVVIHDMFDTLDATAILMKPVIQHHQERCQALCFNYPGQAHTTWPRLSAAERAAAIAQHVNVSASGEECRLSEEAAVAAAEVCLNNEWHADRLHELLLHVERDGDFLLTRPFHLVAMGNGAAIAAMFVQKYGHHPQYRDSLRSIVSVNGYVSTDGTLAAALSGAEEVFAAAPASRPDVAVSYWSRLLFCDEYLRRVGPPLALNILTAVANPITTEGRLRLVRGALRHRSMRGAFSPILSSAVGSCLQPVEVPVVILQSTENLLVSASAVESMLVGRSARHLWSHQLNFPSDALKQRSALDANGSFVGRLAASTADYARFSTLGRGGLTALHESLGSANGAFVMWVRAGHAIAQEQKGAVLDLLDFLACPTLAAAGLDLPERPQSPMEVSSSIGEFGVQVPSVSVPPKTVVLSRNVTVNGDSRSASTEKSVSGVLGESETVKSGASNTSTLSSLDAAIGSILSSALPVTQRSITTSSTDDETIESPQRSARGGSSRRALLPPLPHSSASNTPRRRPSAVATAVAAAAALSAKATEDESGVALESENCDDAVTPINGLSRSGSNFNILSSSPRGEVHSAQVNGDLTVNSLTSPMPTGDWSEGFALPNEEKISTTENIPNALSGSAPVNMSTTGKVPVTEVASVLECVPSISSVMGGAIPDSTPAQRSAERWTNSQPPPLEAALRLEDELRRRQAEYLELEARLRHLRAEAAHTAPLSTETPSAPLTIVSNSESSTAVVMISHEEVEAAKTLSVLGAELASAVAARDAAEKQRRIDIQADEDALVSAGLLPPYVPPEPEALPVDALSTVAVREMAPLHYRPAVPLPAAMIRATTSEAILDGLVADEKAMAKHAELARQSRLGHGDKSEVKELTYGAGELTVDEFERIKATMLDRQLVREQRLATLSAEELFALQTSAATVITRLTRGFLARRRAGYAAALREVGRQQTALVVRMQAVVRGGLGRRRYKRLREAHLDAWRRLLGAIHFQRLWRGTLARRLYRRLRSVKCAIIIQRVFRGSLGRAVAARERWRLEMLRRKTAAAVKIQSTWRRRCAMEEFFSLRIHRLAAVEVQRVWRGYLGRKRIARRRLWESTRPGPERIALGLTFIEESQAAFGRQQEEIDALHRATERAEARVSHIHAELRESEAELVLLERELQEIDQIERDLAVLSHDRLVLTRGDQDGAGMSRTATDGTPLPVLMGRESSTVVSHSGPGGEVISTDPLPERRKRAAEAYALEMAIALKRSEREKKRQELEIEFASVFATVEKKKAALRRLELSLAEMEATRERKTREFSRLQANLMQLLLEQKQELDDLREKGLELETATATTAAAAVATAHKAKEHEEKSRAMFSQTEELMKFQFMSMSLSYFSSLNMLKSLREMNSDTTSAAIALSAEASATAAATASAANLPNLKTLTSPTTGGSAGAIMAPSDFMDTTIRRKKADLEATAHAKAEYATITASPLPANVKTWTISDVRNWLASLSLSQYADAFAEGSVDGPFLLELREEDLVQVLGIRHRLHVRKILVSREALRPLSDSERHAKAIVDQEDESKMIREEAVMPSADTVFSQARNGRNRRVEESLNLGFPVDGEDEKGNTLLIVATQNRNRRLVEMLLLRGANVNHQNAAGNTPLHYALALDTEGVLAEYLIEQGADDTLENVNGHTPYDGI